MYSRLVVASKRETDRQRETERQTERQRETERVRQRQYSYLQTGPSLWPTAFCPNRCSTRRKRERDREREYN